MEWFTVIEFLGQGNYSEIYKAKDKKTGEFYAIK